MPERPGVDNLVAALDLRTQALRGFAVGVLVAAAAYYFFVVMSGGSLYDPFLVALAGVLAFTAGLLATLAFAIGAAVRLARSLDQPPARNVD
ncbi:DUF7536 family protein [Halobacterium zhouii]|uniref:DUF7536 family protein n=1 Tax=Halobacterium zhouii TaxID=2902624 RepID=UPI001E4B5E5A|nr:hypothetical protein [Halobacterium zhouii]